MGTATTLRVGLIGDFDARITAHRAIGVALPVAAQRLRLRVEPVWLATDTLTDAVVLRAVDGLWCVPGSPYRSMEGALRGIGYARAMRVPYLGTCGGFQHAVIEYARAVLGWDDAEHAETAPDAPRCVVAPLVCRLIEAEATVRLAPGSRIAAAYGRDHAAATYHCSYGLNPEFRDALLRGPLRATAFDDAGEVRAVELEDHPFFVATLFQPEREALLPARVPLVEAFLSACGAGRNV